MTDKPTKKMEMSEEQFDDLLAKQVQVKRRQELKDMFAEFESELPADSVTTESTDLKGEETEQTE